MIVVYTCPKCGADLEELVVATYPPQYIKRCRKCGWQSIEQDEIVRIPYEPGEYEYPAVSAEWTNADNLTPSCCRGCSNHPSNGGSGICNCTLPYMTKEWGITC